MNHCVFCPIPPDVEILFEQDGIVVFEPLNPVTPGHILVVPRNHCNDFADHWQTAMAVMKVASQYIQEQRRIGVVEDCNLITSLGSAATQTVFHLHIHLVPRNEGDGLKLPWTDQ